MGGALIGDPAAKGGVDGVLQGLGAGVDGHHGRAQKAHPAHVVRLANHVGRAHVDHALQIQHGGGGGRGHAVHARARLGQQHGLAHVPAQQALADGVVYLVRARVV